MIVIGAGPAGLNAALYASRFGLSVTVVERGVMGGQAAQTHLIENYLGFESIPGYELAERMVSHVRRHGVEFMDGRVGSLAVEDGIMKVGAGSETLAARSVVIAAGCRPRRLGVGGEEAFLGMGVSYCATCDGAFFKGKAAVVAGGGNTALGDAVFLSKLCSRVYVVHRRGAFRADEALVRQARSCGNVEFVMGAVVSALLGDKALSGVVVRGVDDPRERRIEAEALF
ncbi:MAG: FAD-dependent oxidoreductase, partial [Oscillospiraceae bacterium]|nr:FAD-dependent oxidoreductase [Oscillospiraceae bacterium]